MNNATRILGVLVMGLVLSSAMPLTTSAGWTATTAAGNAARSASTSMPSGNKPTATATPPSSATVAVAWVASSGGAPVAGYEVRSYDASTGVPRAVGAACAGIVASTSCTETNVPSGSWRYSVVPRQQAWAGAASPLSDPVVAVGGYFLHDNPTPPTGDTTSQVNLSFSLTAPTATTLYNYDTNRDALPGRLVARSSNGAGESDPNKYQNWRGAVLSTGVVLSGTSTVTLWSAMENFDVSKVGEVGAYLRDFNPSTSTYVELANATLTLDPWQGGSGTWVSRTIDITVPASAVAAGHQIELKLVATTGAGADMWFAYDTSAYPSSVTLPIVTDTTPPVIASSIISKTVPYVPGYIRQGGTYYVYANVTDNIGFGSVTADVSAVTAGQTAVALTAGSYTAGGVSYNYRSASLTAGNPLAAGTKAYTVSATDVAGNAASPAAFSVTVDNTAPSASDIQTTNTGTVGHPELGDTVIYTFSEPIDPQSILAGWTGTSTNVVVRIENNAAGDRVTIRNAANSAALPFGTVSLVGTNYVTANRDFGASGTPSTMVISGSTITVTLGTASGAVATQILPGIMIWTPSASATDRAGNACLVTPALESGILDTDL